MGREPQPYPLQGRAVANGRSWLWILPLVHEDGVNDFTGRMHSISTRSQ